jgi:hypothetical protein
MPLSVWCFKPVCHCGRTLFLEQRSVASQAARLAEHEKECQAPFSGPARRQKEGLSGYYIRALWDRRPQGLGDGMRPRLLRSLEPEVRKKEFATYFKALLNLKMWLLAQKVTHVAMESTGVYWKPVWQVLEHRSLMVTAL